MASLEQSTATLAGKKLTLSFVPASQADLDLINSYLPKPHADGSPIQPSELPGSLPGYLIRLKAEIRLDGQPVSQGGAVNMGSELRQTSAYYNPGSRQWEEGEANHPIAGEYHALGLDLAGVGAAQLDALKTRLQATKARLEQFQANPNDPTPIQALTKEDLSGDLLYSGILGYFASVDGSDQLAARAGKQALGYRLPSYGTFLAAANPSYFFGIVRNVAFPGLIMDVDRLAVAAEALDNDAAKRIAYVRQVGAAGSAFEHAVPERLFADPNKALDDPSQPQGVSAVKAIALAAAQGQKIYTLNNSNQATHAATLAQLQIDENVRAEIANALAAGLEVTVHQSAISAYGWTGSGYILIDPETGAGAYKISGGANGAFLVALYISVLIAILSVALTFLGAGLGALIALAPFYALSWVFKNVILKLDPEAQFLIAYVEFSMVAVAVVIAPHLFIWDFLLEIVLYSMTVLSL
jgi:hypothetical protein